VGLALFAEGSSDYHFLGPVLRRSTEWNCLRESASVELGEVYRLVVPDGVKKGDRSEQILTASLDARGAFDLLFVHADGGGNVR